MDIEKIKKHLNDIDNVAYSGEEYIQDCKNFLDYGYYAVIKDLYTTYKVGGLSKEESIQAKEIYQNQYIDEYNKNNSHKEMYKGYQEAILKSDILRCEINKSNDAKEMFYKVNLKKIME